MFSFSDLSAFGITDPGLRRSINEDAYLVDLTGRCLVVADGVGGAAAGEIASGLFVSTAARLAGGENNSSEQKALEVIRETFLQANGAILAHASEHPESQGMACTAEMIIFFDGGFVLGHVGDSRTYRRRNNSLTRLTKDHSFIQEQLEAGKISEAEAKSHRYRNVILRAVGNEESIDVDIIRGKVKPGDLFLLCSDGLTDMVTEQEILDCLVRDESLETKGCSLVERANRNGGKDNITVVLGEVPA